MSRSDLVAEVAEFRDVDRGEFEARVREEAERIKEGVRDGRFDNAAAIVGLEYELYGVGSTGALTRVPRRLLTLIGFEREVGLHQAELHTSPQPLSRYGLDAQEAELRARLDAALSETLTEGIRLVSDGMWTIPPEGETARGYLTESAVEDGIRIAANVSPDARYHAQGNLEPAPRMRIEAPGVSFDGGTVLLNGLTTSIQPHYQVPRAADLPEYFRYALRIAGPLLALGVNSPFFPPDLYDGDATAREVLDDAWMESRIAVFESVMNPADGPEKVRFPRDVGSVEEAIDRIADDPTVVPRLFETGDRFADGFSHFRHKHGSYWRWVRPVFGGATRSKANARIEFRPLPAQPTIRDSVAFLAAFAGLLEGLRRRDHPVRSMEWEVARDNFYAAMRDGLAADLRWIDAGGDERTGTDEIYAELFEFAVDGLEGRGLPAERAERFVSPLRARVNRRTTPARWKLDAAGRRVEEGAPLAEAIGGAQVAYVRRQADTLIGGDFTEWIPPG